MRKTITAVLVTATTAASAIGLASASTATMQSPSSQDTSSVARGDLTSTQRRAALLGCGTLRRQSYTRAYQRNVYRREEVSWSARRRIARLQRCTFSVKARLNLQRHEKRQLEARRARQEAARIAAMIPDHLRRIAQCESGGNPRAVSPSGQYRGKYQFDYATWASVGGSGDPAAASEAEQDKRALILYSRRGSQPWPVCQHR